MNQIEVRELVPSEFKEWDQLVEKTQPGTPFHTSDWLGIYRDVLSRDIRIYGCFRNDELVGGCPIFVKSFKGILKVASSICSMTDYCGPLISESSSSKISKIVQENHEILNSLRDFLCTQGLTVFTLNSLRDLRTSGHSHGTDGTQRFTIPITWI